MKISKEGLITESKVRVVQHLIPLSNKTSRPNVKMNPQSITIHNTGNPNADALDNSKYVDTATGYVSWHFTVGDSVVYQELPIYEHSWHAGDGVKGEGNLTSIAIEISEEEGDKAYHTAIKFISELLIALKWDANKLKPHQSWSGKYCPRLILPIWNSDFIPKIKQEIDKLKKEANQMGERIDIRIKTSGKIIEDLEKKTIEDVKKYLDLYEVVQDEEKLYEYCGYPLKKGMYNDPNNAVLQRALKELNYYNMPIDEHFGAGSHNSVINFEVERNLDVTGIVTERVADEINKALIEKRDKVENPTTPTKPDTSEFDNFKPLVKLIKPFGYYTKFGQTRPVQFALKEIDKVKYNIEIDGHFGRGSQSALNDYKKSKGLPQDGLVDELTWKHLHFDLWKKQENEDLKINWYDNQTKVIRVKKDEIDFITVKANKSVDSLINMMNTVDGEVIVACSGGLFGMSNGVTLSSLIVDGKIETMGVYSRWAISQDKDNEIKLRGLNWEQQIGTIGDIISAIGGCPSLIVGGEKNVDLTGISNEPAYINNNHPRLCIGLDEEYFYFIVSHGRNSTKGYCGENVNDMVKIGLELKIIDLIMLDGGNSIQVRKGKKENFERLDDSTSNRLVDNAVVLVKKRKV